MDFIVSSPSPGVWVLNENEAVTLYLIAGRERAVLLDTGFDRGELPALVRELTPLPIMLVNSHAHIDHVVGNHFWPETCIHPLELEELQNLTGTEPIPVHFLQDGDKLELGGRTLEVLHVPGHTPGSIALLDRENRLLFAGDTIMVGTVPINKYENGVSDYKASLDRLWDMRGDYDLIYPSHRSFPLTHQELSDLRECAALALDGSTPQVEFTSSIITPRWTRANLLRSGYKKGSCSVTMKILGQLPE